jgi:ABC-2 type transport system permease protein
VARFASAPNFRQVATLTHAEEITPQVDGQRVLLVLHIGPRFSRELLGGSSAPVQVIVDGRNSNTAAILLNYVGTIMAAFNTDWQQRTGGATALAHLETRAWFNPNLASRWFIVPGIVGLLTLVVTTLVTALSVAREREQGTFDQLLVTPFRPGEILVGKALPGFIIGLFEATLIILLAVLWFQVPLRGSLLTLYVGLFCFLLSTVGMGLMISSLAVTQQQGLLGAFLFLVPSIILSGFATPIANMPYWVQQITYLNPLRYFLIILRGVFLEGTPFHLLMDQFWPMAIIGVLNLLLAGYLFRHRMY